MSEVLVVDRKGLARKLAKKPKAFLVYELMANAWDEDITRVSVTMEMLPGRPACELVVEDDCPEGFQDLASVYTMFRDSKKAPDPTKRGRFELGEKLVLALAIDARITSTKGTIIIENEERRQTRERTEKGTIFAGTFHMTRDEFDEVCEQIRQVIPPPGIVTKFNGKLIQPRVPIHSFETVLQTVRADDEGNLVSTSRKTAVEVYEVRRGEIAHIYEMGLPVVETADKWHYDVCARVPVNWERNNVPPSYKKTLRVEVLNAMHDRISREEASAQWVTDAAEDPRAVSEAVKDVVVKRFGEKAVVYDPSDPEGSKLAMSKGYTVIPGGALSRGFWDNVRRDGAVLPAGQVTPSPRAYDPDARPEHVIPEAEWTADMKRVAAFAGALHKKLIGKTCAVRIVREPDVRWLANYGDGLCLNYAALGKAWFAKPNRSEAILDLLVHELAHFHGSDHLSEKYHDGLSLLAARLTNLALDEPRLFG